MQNKKEKREQLDCACMHANANTCLHNDNYISITYNKHRKTSQLGLNDFCFDVSRYIVYSIYYI